MPNKTKQNTKNSTEQICSQPLYKSQTTHHTQPTPKQQTPKLAAQANHHHTGDRRQHGVEREPDSVSAYTLIPNPKHAPTPTTPQQGSKHMRAQENNQHTNHTGQRTNCSPQNGLPRKEVIQPHLPVRLPCYDFVPIANPTFDHSPHQKWWLGHGLRVLPTFMT